MTTLKSVLVPKVSTDMTTVYTNSTGFGAVLKSMDLVNVADNVLTSTTAATEDWTFFGNGLQGVHAPDHTSASIYGVPYPIRLSGTRVLLIFQPHHLHTGATVDMMSTGLHTQVVEYQTDRWVAGPICDMTVALPNTTTSIFSMPSSMANFGQSCIKGVALTPTKVALVIRQGSQFNLYRLTISGNVLESVAPASLALHGASYFNSTTPYAFDIALVPGNTNKVLVMGVTSTVAIQPFNIPDSGALSSAAANFSTGLTATQWSAALGQHNRVATANVSLYTVAGMSTASNLNIQLMSYNSSTNAFTMLGSVANATVSTVYGLQVGCVANGMSGNSVVAIVESTTMSFYRQVDPVQASIVKVAATLQHAAAARSIWSNFEWGEERAVFVGRANTIVVYDSTGNYQNMIPATDSVGTEGTSFFYPFDRPLYTITDTTTNPAYAIAYQSQQYFTRKNVSSATSIGERDTEAMTYMPYGHDYNLNYDYSAIAECWIIGAGCKLLAVSPEGKVLNQVVLAQLYSSIGNGYHRVSRISVGKSGRIYFTSEGQGASVSYPIGVVYSSITTLTLGWSTNILYKPAMLSALGISATPNSIGHVATDITTFYDVTGSEIVYNLVAYHTAGATQIHYAVCVNGGVWTPSGNVGVASTTTGAHNVGINPPIKFIQTTPISSLVPRGKWRLIGMNGTQSAGQISSNFYMSTTEYEQVNFGSLACATPISASTCMYPLVKRDLDGLTVFAGYDSTISKTRIITSVNGQQTQLNGWISNVADTKRKLTKLSGARGGYTIARMNSDILSGTPTYNAPAQFITFDKYGAIPAYYEDGTWGIGACIIDNVRPYTWHYKSGSTSKKLQGSSIEHKPSVSVAITDGTTTTMVTANAGVLMPNPNVSYRSTDAYLIPNGYSIKMRSTVPNSVSAVISVVEDS
jgi:hypothetical protein